MQNWGLRLIVFFTVLHVFVMKFNGWVRWYLVGGEATLARPELPGGGLLVGWLLFFAVLIRLAEFGGVKFARLVCYLSAVLIPLIFGFTFWWGSLTVAKGAACLSRTQVENAVKNDKKCLVIFSNKVYDMTLASRWDLTGHLGRHLCGKEYSKEEIEKGPHPVSVMDKFLLTELCQGK